MSEPLGVRPWRHVRAVTPPIAVAILVWHHPPECDEGMVELAELRSTGEWYLVGGHRIAEPRWWMPTPEAPG